MKSKLSPLVLLYVLCLALLPLSSKADVVVRPPIWPNGEEMAEVMLLSSDIEVLFLTDAEDIEITVCAEDGTIVYQVCGSAYALSKVVIDAADWKGTYIVTLHIKDMLLQYVVEYP